ncbi:stAR-related lipid transfer protein 6 isoform X3 [Rhineura floridana]|uniref:stAR-related lipid transfer protein 6 isoform X3 n=1 Tax=Rhineura floridana TaxID=261503 RepID=UPI002AC7F9DC|nr:stAR-related lipid transfer protein 6 isoform X3 [Rhineura floridana]
MESGKIYRAEALIEVPAAKLFPFIYCAEYRSKWDRALQSYKLVDTIDEDTFIYRSITHSYGMGLVSPRDFVFLLHIKKYGDLMTTNSLSVDHPDYPPCQNYVRGTSFPSGYACCPLPGCQMFTDQIVLLSAAIYVCENSNREEAKGQWAKWKSLGHWPGMVCLVGPFLQRTTKQPAVSPIS